jgi:hypothetical protein
MKALTKLILAVCREKRCLLANLFFDHTKSISEIKNEFASSLKKIFARATHCFVINFDSKNGKAAALVIAQRL